MQYLQQKGIKLNSLQDLTNATFYTDLLKVIISNIDNILFYDYRLEKMEISNKNIQKSNGLK